MCRIQQQRRECAASTAGVDLTILVFAPSRRPDAVRLHEGFGWYAIIMRDYCRTARVTSVLWARPIWAYLNSRTQPVSHRHRLVLAFELRGVWI